MTNCVFTLLNKLFWALAGEGSASHGHSLKERAYVCSPRAYGMLSLIAVTPPGTLVGIAMINSWSLDSWKLCFGVLQPGDVRGRLRGERVNETWLVLGTHAENFEVWRDLGVCLSQITSLGEGKRALYADLANSFYVRRRPVEKKIRSQRKVKEHFLTSDNNHLSGSSCLCAGRKEHLLVVQDQDAKLTVGWLSPGSWGSTHTVFPSFTQVRYLQQNIWDYAFAICTSLLFESGGGTFSTEIRLVSLTHLRTPLSPCQQTSGIYLECNRFSKFHVLRPALLSLTH